MQIHYVNKHDRCEQLHVSMQNALNAAVAEAMNEIIGQLSQQLFLLVIEELVIFL